MKPVFVSRSFIVDSSKTTKKGHTFTSNTFILRFEDGSEKFINQKSWVDTRLLTTYQLEATISNPIVEYLGKDTCPLYYQEW
jgi:hypothetical protein